MSRLSMHAPTCSEGLTKSFEISAHALTILSLHGSQQVTHLLPYPFDREIWRGYFALDAAIRHLSSLTSADGQELVGSLVLLCKEGGVGRLVGSERPEDSVMTLSALVIHEARVEEAYNGTFVSKASCVLFQPPWVINQPIAGCARSLS
jgi:hypothetical protein